MPKEIILKTDDTAATLKTVTGWVSRNGRFFGKDEEMARYDGATHNQCACGEIVNKGWVLCDKCRESNLKKLYSELEYKPWDGKTPLAIYRGDTYFFDEDELLDYLEEEDDLQLEDVKLVLCHPIRLSTIPDDFWADDLPDDCDIPTDIANKVAELNELIRNHKTTTWEPTNIRTSYEKP